MPVLPPIRSAWSPKSSPSDYTVRISVSPVQKWSCRWCRPVLPWSAALRTIPRSNRSAWTDHGYGYPHCGVPRRSLRRRFRTASSSPLPHRNCLRSDHLRNKSPWSSPSLASPRLWHSCWPRPCSPGSWISWHASSRAACDTEYTPSPLPRSRPVPVHAPHCPGYLLHGSHHFPPFSGNLRSPVTQEDQ